MKVIKFGGTSVGSADSIKKVLHIIESSLHKSKDIMIVCSAMATVTNNLLQAGTYAKNGAKAECLEIVRKIERIHLNAIHNLLPLKIQSVTIAQIKTLLNKLEDILEGVLLLHEFSPKSQDLVASFGELMSCHILTNVLKEAKINAEFIDARELIKTNANFTNALVDFDLTNQNLKAFAKQVDTIPVITGFIASTVTNNQTTTLGRGGSDYTTAIIAAALSAELIEIWTDVNGVMTADPKLVKKAFTIPSLSYHEAMELSHFGAKIIYTPTLYPIFKHKIPLYVKNTFSPKHPGTLVMHKSVAVPFMIKGISSIDNVDMLLIEGATMAGVPGVLGRIFTALAKKNISVILVTQASSEYSICVIVDAMNGINGANAINSEFQDEITTGKINKVRRQDELSILSIIGENMHKNSGIAGKLYASLGKNGINVVAIAQGSSELNISTVIEKKQLSKALNVTHEAFFTAKLNTLNLFMVGTGLVGSTLLKQIYTTSAQLLKDKRLKINLIALANSKKMLFDVTGIPLSTWQNKLSLSKNASNINQFIKNMLELNLPNAIFIDCTNSKEIVSHYRQILDSSISITTPNKIANSSAYPIYKSIRHLADKEQVKFMYETNVGAGLPVISTLQNLMLSGDSILKIEGVLSGTLSYIFNNFNQQKKFSAVIKEAKEKGYTEPDPRDDLSGIDVARKILILAREVGAKINLSDVQLENLLPPSCQKAKTVNEFFLELEKYDASFEKRRLAAEKKNKVLRYIAKYENGVASVNVLTVDNSHPFYALSGSDNIIAFTTQRYKERPLVIQGPGAGSEVTASGVFADIIAISSYLKG